MNKLERITCRGFVASTTALLLLLAHVPARASSGDMEMVLARFYDASGPVHAIRWNSGYWTGWGNIAAASNSFLPDVLNVATARVWGTSHTVVVITDHAGYRLSHAIREGGGAWTGFTSIEPFAGDVGDPWVASCAAIGGTLHVIAATVYQVWHASRRTDGSWTRFGVIYNAPAPVTIGDVSLASSPGNRLHAVITLRNGQLLHGEKVIGAQASWSYNELGRNVTQASVSTVGDDVHVAALRSGQIVHRQRYSNGWWSPFLDVAPYTGNSLPAGEIVEVSISGSPTTGQVHLATILGNFGRVYHALRFPNGAWSTFNHVDPWTGYSGRPNQISMAAQ